MFGRKTETRRWFRKKRWWVVLIIAGVAVYQNYQSGNTTLQEQVNSLLELLPMIGE